MIGGYDTKTGEALTKNEETLNEMDTNSRLFQTNESRKENAFISTNCLRESNTTVDGTTKNTVSKSAILSKEDLLTGGESDEDRVMIATNSSNMRCRSDSVPYNKSGKGEKISALLSKENIMKDMDKRGDTFVNDPVKIRCRSEFVTRGGRTSALLSKEDLEDADDQGDTIESIPSRTVTERANEGYSEKASLASTKTSQDGALDMQLSTKEVSSTTIYTKASATTIYTKASATSVRNKKNSATEEPALYFIFREKKIPVRYQPHITHTIASMALTSDPFLKWVKRTSRISGTKCFHLHGVMIDSVSFAAAGNTDSMECSSSSSNSYISGETRDIECNRGRNASHIVESIKIKTHCTLEDEDLTLKAQNITGTCTLKGDCIGILVNLFCVDDDSSWSFLVDQPSVAIGATSSLSLPEGQVICGDIGGMVVALIEDACSLTLNTSTMTNLTEKAFACSISNIHNGLCPSSGSSSESVQIMSIEKRITKMELQTMRCQLSELRERGETITLRVVPIEDMWKISNDMKVICALFLMEKIAKMKMPQISKRHNSSSSFEKMNNVVIRNRLGGLYKHVKKKFDGK